jgi:hypothetical protein
MEFVIPGLILVALMVYASTKIKRRAAEAFEPENIESELFAIDKPDGFLNVLNLDPSLKLDIYSKEFGTDEASGFRAARLELRIYEKRTLAYATKALEESTKVTSKISEMIDGQKYNVLEAESVEKGIGFREMYKLAEKGGRVFELKLKTLEDADSDITAKAEQMLVSFEVK